MQSRDQFPAQSRPVVPVRLRLLRGSLGRSRWAVSGAAIAGGAFQRRRSGMNDGFQDLVAPQGCGDRWRLFQRLQELGIACDCSYGQPLRLRSLDTLSFVQLWSICRQCRCDRHALTDWLTTCWQQPSAVRQPQDR
ncbi:MAG: hypothetical protein MH825_06160 [Cyanobacteria bacterium]|nr:hypothetical protein [Cyanobacteriota bacterium]